MATFLRFILLFLAISLFFLLTNADDTGMDHSDTKQGVQVLGQMAIDLENKNILENSISRQKQGSDSDADVLIFDRVLWAKIWVRENGTEKHVLCIRAKRKGDRKYGTYYATLILDPKPRITDFKPHPWDS